MNRGGVDGAGGSLLGLMPGDLENCNQAASFLQSGFWGSFKAGFGWSARAFLARWKDTAAPAPLLVIRRRLGPGVSFAYVPWGPELPPALPPAERPAALRELARALRGYLPRDTVFVRFDPPWPVESADNRNAALGRPFVRAGADVQPPDTVIVSLAGGSMETVLAGMKPKGRYNARLALKRGVTTRQAGADSLGVFYALLKETARRDGLAIHSVDYYQALFDHARDYSRDHGGAARPALDVRLYLAEREGEVLAAIVTLFRGREAVYLYGASSDRQRNLMAPYALQVKAMEDALAAGCEDYDLFGIPPNDDPGHPMAGLYRFKTNFGGRIVHRLGSWDYAYNPVVYRAFRAAESLRARVRALRKRRVVGPPRNAADPRPDAEHGRPAGAPPR